jgi:hypothetical protein
MFQSPKSLTLWSYSPEVHTAIEQKWGKLWVLELIATNNSLSQELEKAWVLVWENLNPLILKNPHEWMSEEEFKLFQKSHLHNERLRNGLDSLTGWQALIRASLPWDWRSLVDVIPSRWTQATLDNINNEIANILSTIKSNSMSIQYYAETTGVPFDMKNLSLWVVTAFDLPIVTITENPNNWDFYIDDFQWKFGGITWWSKIFTTTTSSDGLTKGGSNPYANKDIIEKVNKMMVILQWFKILDSTIAYQFEFGKTYSGRLILFQIKEVSKKISAIVQLKSTYPLQASKLLYWGNHGYSLPVIPALMPGEWMKTRDIRNDTREWFAYFGNNSSDASLKPHEIDPNMRGVFSGDSHGGSLVHNSFRYVQQVLQSGGIALLGDKIWGMFDDPAMTNNTLEDLKAKNIHIGKNQEWMIEIWFTWWDNQDDTQDIVRKLSELSWSETLKKPFPKRRDEK